MCVYVLMSLECCLTDPVFTPQGAVPAGAELCGGRGMAASISVSIDALLGGDASAAVFDKTDDGEITVRPL